MKKDILHSITLIILAVFLACLFIAMGAIHETDILTTVIQVAITAVILSVAIILIVILRIALPLKARITAKDAELQRVQDEFTVASDRMGEGLVILDSHYTIISLNRMAMELLETGTNCVGYDIRAVSEQLGLTELLQRADGGEHVEKLTEFNNMEYLLKVSAVVSDGVTKGYVLLIFDATELERSERIRREFTANVSHELKTPLHSILGCAELLQSGFVKPEDSEQFSGQIYSEAKRMVRLIDDIMNLSRLDEGAVDMQRADIDLYELAIATVESLAGEAEEAGVILDVSGESSVINGVPPLLSGIILNLCDNAIKYNRENGSVTVSVTDEEDSAVLRVADTGIGIPEEHQSRVFERFYRVDKSHSKEVGGTGLGLSIVKHSARLHGAKIEMESVHGEGTTITLRFPKYI